jgi:hypothetical protein
MDYRHHKRIHSSFVINTNHFLNILRSSKTTRKPRHVHQAILNFFKRIAVPVATVSSTFLFANFAHASTFSDIVLRRKGIATTDFTGDHKTTWAGIGEIVKNIQSVFNFFGDIKQHLYQWSIDLLSWVYSTLTDFVLYTPLFIFNNDFVKNTSMIFSLSSVCIVTVLTIYESIMKMLNKKHTDFKQILKRFPVVVAVSGLAPFIFEKSFQFINQLTKGIVKMGGAELTGETFKSTFQLGSMDVFGLLLFDVVLIALLIKILLQNGKRWWDLFCLSATSPLALTAWVFDRHSHFFTQWWNSVKRLSLVQLVYATFILLIGLFIYGTRFIAVDNWIIKLLIILGGLYRLANPPQFVLSYTRGDDISDTINDYKKTAKGLKKTLDARNYHPVRILAKQIVAPKIKSELRVKHGKRFVDDLIK